MTGPAVYQDSSGAWFFRCRTCYSFDGAFPTKNRAEIALYSHFLKVHTL